MLHKVGVMTRYIIDRFERDFALCENESKEIVDIPRDSLPPEAVEGDVLMEEDGRFTVDEDETKERRRKNAALLKSLWKDEE